MKKFFIAIVALAAAVACSNDDIISIDRQAIGFGNPFVENATRATDPSYSNSNNLIREFKVWGDVTGNAGASSNILLYNGTRVYTEDSATPVYGEAYKCDQTEYWIPSATYNFVAIANATSVTPATGFPETISYTANGETDLIYTKVGETVTTDDKAVPSQNPVAFTFNHLLSKVHFNFTNTSSSNLFTFDITDIQISGAYASGVYTIGAATPWAATGSTTFNFGSATGVTTTTSQTSTDARLIIPGEQTWKVSFTRKTYYNGNLMSTDSYTGDDAYTLNYTFVENGAYVINVELSAGLPIDFSVGSLDEWDSETSISIP